MKQNNSNEIGKANNWALINGGYGVFGESGYDYYDPRVGDTEPPRGVTWVMLTLHSDKKTK